MQYLKKLCCHKEAGAPGFLTGSTAYGIRPNFKPFPDVNTDKTCT